jgi:hypothetical protein
MKPQRWFLITLAAIVVIATAAIAINISFDIYGVFRDAHGRRLGAFGDDRVAKYLLSRRYVPANFNAVLVGTSVSANWNTGKISALRVYNESMSAANIVEEKALVENALSQPGIQVALLIVHPYLTNSHRFATIQPSYREMVGALGSLTLWDAYKVRYGLGGPREPYDEYGTDDFGSPKKLNPLLQRMMDPHTDFEVDPLAMLAYKDLIKELRRHNVELIYIVPPVSETLFFPKHDAFLRYFRQFQAVIQDNDMPMLIDFTADEFSRFRNPKNFSDGVHLHPEATDSVVSTLDTRLKQWLASGKLHVADRQYY